MEAATSPVSLHGIALACSASHLRALTMLVLSTLWLAACASLPATGLDCAAANSECTSVARPKVVIDADEWKNARDPRGLMVLIQSNLDRVSAGQPVWPAPKGVVLDVRLQIVEVYADFLRGDFKDMDATLAKVDPAAAQQRTAVAKDAAKLTANWPIPPDPQAQNAMKVYFAALDSGEHSMSPLIRLYTGLRAVDQDTTAVSLTGAKSLRLPCRTVIGRVPQFVAATDALKSLGGRVLDCPVDGPADFAKDEMLASHPGQFSPHITPTPNTNETVGVSSTPAAPPPGSRAAAFDEMDTHSQQAAPILEHYSHVDAQGELDYALFLHSFERQTPARDATIHTLQNDLQKKAIASPGMVDDFPVTPYDGTDDSLLNIIRLASETGITNSTGYDIPCAFLTAHPTFIAATQPYYFSNRDNSMPRSGCAESDYVRMGFPAKAVAAFETASTQADGNFIDSFQGSMVYGFETARNAVNTSMRINPQNLSATDPSYPSLSFDYPYEVWGYTSLNNYVVSLRIRKLYLAAHDQLAAYYQKHLQLNRTDSENTARAALFLAVLGGNCGGDVPTTSLRRMLLEHASLHDITRQLGTDGSADAAEVGACAQYAGLDPLLLVAVGDPKAFPAVLKAVPDVTARKAIGKTALMEAAQFDQAGIVDLLLEHHAAVNATTWANQDGFATQLSDDARTALMYAAANGSPNLIKALLYAGADPYQADTKGRRAIDYLLGYGPTRPNPHLSERQRKRAAQWLF